MDDINTDAQMFEYQIDLIRNLLREIGEKKDREGLIGTPKRVIKSWRELYSGYKQDAEQILKTSFTETNGYDQIILLKDIEFFSTCEHHMLPFFGKVHVGYLPNKRVVGISKLARVVEIYSRRLQIQERLTQQIADSIYKILKCQGVGVVIEAEHLCMRARGVQKQNSVMTTSALHGMFLKPDVKEEFVRLIK